MPLSEHEQRLLDQIEQALYADDPKFASTVRGARRRVHARRWVTLSVLGILAGFGLVAVGLATKLIFLGVIGFVLIVAACTYAATAVSRRHQAAGGGSGGGGGSAGAGRQRRSGVRSRMEDRLRRRFDET